MFWWDTYVEKNKGAAQKRGIRSDTALTSGKDGLPDKLTISRWRRKLNEPAAFERTFAEALTKYIRILEQQTGAPVGQNSGEFKWSCQARSLKPRALSWACSISIPHRAQQRTRSSGQRRTTTARRTDSRSNGRGASG